MTFFNARFLDPELLDREKQSHPDMIEALPGVWVTGDKCEHADSFDPWQRPNDQPCNDWMKN